MKAKLFVVAETPDQKAGYYRQLSRRVFGITRVKTIRAKQKEHGMFGIRLTTVELQALRYGLRTLREED